MGHIHKKFTTEQIKALLDAYENGHISRAELEHTLGIGRSRFFALIKLYRSNSGDFTIEYQRRNDSRLGSEVEEKIHQELLRDKALIDDQAIPVHTYNYAALTDRLKQEGVHVSTTTVVKRAITQGCYIPKKKKEKVHDREVLTSAVGDLVQHDASLHKWSPYATSKWSLITSLDDHSRMILFGDFFESETTWAHIQAVQSVMQEFGIPHRYYVDSLRVFRFIQHQDSVHYNQRLSTDDVLTQWRNVLHRMNTDVVYALSPQAKGKIERPFRWLQDRIVRTCALEHVSSIEDARFVLQQEIHRYNYLQLHSTTQEIPAIRFDKAIKEKRSLLRPFALPSPYSSTKDVFCVCYHRIADGYRKVSFSGFSFQIPGIFPREELDLHLVPFPGKDLVEIRFWANKKLVHTANLPIQSLKNTVHF
jgi:hypothetical protein